MNSKLCKKIRNAVYGELSKRNQFDYEIKPMIDKKKKQKEIKPIIPILKPINIIKEKVVYINKQFQLIKQQIYLGMGFSEGTIINRIGSKRAIYRLNKKIYKLA